MGDRVALPAPSGLACGEQLEWGRWILAMWQDLADPGGVRLFPLELPADVHP